MTVVTRLLGLLMISSSLLGCTHVSQRSFSYDHFEQAIKPFDTVSIEGDLDVHIQTAQSFYDVAVNGEPGDLKKLVIVVKDHQLLLKRPQDFSHNKVSVVIYMWQLNGLTYSGAGEVECHNIQAHNLRIRVLDKGAVTLSGKAKQLHATVAGHARLNARGLKAATVYINTTGFGQAEVRNSRGLSALAADRSSIYYYQDPQGQFPYLRGSGAFLRMTGLPHKNRHQGGDLREAPDLLPVITKQ